MGGGHSAATRQPRHQPLDLAERDEVRVDHGHVAAAAHLQEDLVRHLSKTLLVDHHAAGERADRSALADLQLERREQIVLADEAAELPGERVHLLELAQVFLDVLDDGRRLAPVVEQGVAVAVGHERAPLVDADGELVGLAGGGEGKWIPTDHSRHVGGVPAAGGVHVQVFAFLEPHQGHRRQSLSRLVVDEHDRIDRRRPRELVGHHRGELEAGGEREGVDLLDPLAGMLFLGHGHELLIHGWSPENRRHQPTRDALSAASVTPVTATAAALRAAIRRLVRASAAARGASSR